MKLFDKQVEGSGHFCGFQSLIPFGTISTQDLRKTRRKWHPPNPEARQMSLPFCWSGGFLEDAFCTNGDEVNIKTLNNKLASSMKHYTSKKFKTTKCTFLPRRMIITEQFAATSLGW
jgi:hypothetical protein